MKKMMPIVLVFLMVLSIYMLVSERLETKKNYENYISEAQELGNMGIVIRSAGAYDNALALKDSFEISLEKGEMYFSNGHLSTALSFGEDLVDKYPKQKEAYEFLLKLYLEKNEYSSFFEKVKEAKKRNIESEVINEMISGVRYVYELGYTDFEEVKSYSYGLWPVYEDGLWGYLDATGRLAINLKYKSANSFVFDVAAVEELDGSWYYIDAQGEKTNVPLIEGQITDLGVLASPVAIAIDDKYGYYSDKFEYKFGEYDFASTFNAGIAAVLNGDKWLLIKDNGEPLSANEYSDVVMDEKNVVFRNDRAFVAIDEAYYMIDTLGNKVTETSYSFAKSFLSDGPAAVKMGDNWGFVDVSGNIVIEAQYDEAHSFINGFAAVCKDGKWGYIDVNNNVCIDFTFDGAMNFNDQGVSLVKDGDSWISLTLYNTDY